MHSDFFYYNWNIWLYWHHASFFWKIGNIVTNSRSLLFLLLGYVLPMLTGFLFLIFLILSREFWRISMWQSGFWIFNFGLFGVEVFNGYFLGLYFCGSIITKTMTFGAMDIYVLDYDIRFQACFGFCVAFCIICSKLTAFWSCWSISTLIKCLKLSWK